MWFYHYSQIGSAALMFATAYVVWRTGVLPKWSAALALWASPAFLHLWIGVPSAYSTIAWIGLTGLLLLDPSADRADNLGGYEMITAGLIFAALAAVLHVYIFVLESLPMDGAADARDVRNHTRRGRDHETAGLQPGLLQPLLGDRHRGRGGLDELGRNRRRCGLVFAGVGSMLAAAVVLIASSPDKARSAVIQGALPLVAVVLLGIGLSMT